MKIKRFVISIIAVAFLAACAMPPPEMPGTTQPTQLAEQPTATHTPAPTSAPEPTATSQPTATHTPSPTPTATAVSLTILDPAPKSTFPTGAELIIRGIDETAVKQNPHHHRRHFRLAAG
jgi:hypothetical protein